MANWIEIVPERYLSAEKMNAINNNIRYIKQKLQELEYPSFMLPVFHDVAYTEVSSILFTMNRTEEVLRTLDENVDWLNPNNADFEWEYITHNKKKEVDRWINYLNFAYGVLNGSIGGPQYLIDSNGNYIVDKNGNYILVYKEF